VAKFRLSKNRPTSPQLGCQLDQYPKWRRTDHHSHSNPRLELRRQAGRSVEIGGNDNMQVILERVKIDLDEDEIRRLIDAVDHYEAYLHSQQRDEEKFRELLVRLRKMLGKRT